MAGIIQQKIDVTLVPNPPVSSVILATDLDGQLKQKDEYGSIYHVGGKESVEEAAGVAVTTGEGVGVSVGVLVGVAVGVTVGVFVGVFVGVAVGVSVGVLVGVAVGGGNQFVVLPESTELVGSIRLAAWFVLSFTSTYDTVQVLCGLMFQTLPVEDERSERSCPAAPVRVSAPATV